jgi:uncharacterized protein YkwD
VPVPACDLAHKRNVISVKAVLIAVVSALFLCACATVSTAYGYTARAKAHRGLGHRHARARRLRVVRCARSSSFHATGRHPHGSRHARRRVSCVRRHSSSHRIAGHGRRPGRHGRSVHGSAPRTHIRQQTPAWSGAGSCADAELTPNGADLERIRAAIMCLVNRERLAHGERPLRPNPRLESAAQGHSEEMSSGGYIGHIGRRGGTPLSRIRAGGYLYSSRIGYELGENIAWGTRWLATPRAIVAAWMTSPGHRENILDPRYRDTAVGVSPHAPTSLARGQAGAIYTQEFGAIFTG